jgi:hypothetical protein
LCSLDWLQIPGLQVSFTARELFLFVFTSLLPVVNPLQQAAAGLHLGLDQCILTLIRLRTPTRRVWQVEDDHPRHYDYNNDDDQNYFYFHFRLLTRTSRNQTGLSATEAQGLREYKKNL